MIVKPERQVMQNDLELLAVVDDHVPRLQLRQAVVDVPGKKEDHVPKLHETHPDWEVDGRNESKSMKTTDWYSYSTEQAFLALNLVGWVSNQP